MLSLFWPKGSASSLLLRTLPIQAQFLLSSCSPAPPLRIWPSSQSRVAILFLRAACFFPAFPSWAGPVVAQSQQPKPSARFLFLCCQLTGGPRLSGLSPTSSPHQTPPLPREAMSALFLTPPSPCALHCPTPYKPSHTLRCLPTPPSSATAILAESP